jgi:hypothetical protein
MYAPLYALQALAIVLSLALIGFVVEAVRRTRLKERYALLWVGAGLALLVLSVYRPLLDRVALSVGVSYPPSLLFLIALFFLLANVLHYSLVLSSHRDSIRRLTQAVALLECELEERRGR